MKKLNTIIKIKERLHKEKKEFSFHTPLKESIERKSFINENNIKNELNSKLMSINSQNNNNTEMINKKRKISKDYSYFSKIKKNNIQVLNKNHEANFILTKVMIEEGSSYEYINSVILLFEKFFNYILKKSQKFKTKSLISKSEDDSLIVKNIDLEEVYEFLNDKTINNYSSSSLSNILSRMRKFTRILNNKENINYRHNIPTNVKKDIGLKLTKDDLNIICDKIKADYNLQLLLIFYFLYFTGLTFSKVSRIKITDFKSDFSILVEKKEKFKKFIIPNIIRNLLLLFIKGKENNSLFLFYDSIQDRKTFSRTQLIKNNISQVIQGCKDFSNNKSSKIIELFGKKRNSKRLNKNLYFLFSTNLNFYDNLNREKDIRMEGIRDSNDNEFFGTKELPEKNENYYSISQLPNTSLIELDELKENSNDNSSNAPSEIYDSSFEKIKELDLIKKIDFEKYENNLKFTETNKKKCLGPYLISISEDFK